VNAREPQIPSEIESNTFAGNIANHNYYKNRKTKTEKQQQQIFFWKWTQVGRAIVKRINKFILRTFIQI
jgi:hypothetical protein